jgi:L-threonine kinase
MRAFSDRATIRRQPLVLQMPSRVTRLKAPATCGELIQGAIDGQDFLINCPIDLFAEVELVNAPAPGLEIEGEDQCDFAKVSAALTRVAELYGVALNHRLCITSPIPRGKGMASSTADITAALGAFIRHVGIELNDEGFASLIASIEPSDCVHYPGIAEINQLTGKLFARFSVPSGLRVMVVDCGGQIETLRFDRVRARAIYNEHRAEVIGLLGELRRGLLFSDAAAIGDAASRSARLSQHVLPKRPLDVLHRVATDNGAVGVNCAHSGTVLGVMYVRRPGRADDIARAIERAFGRDLPLLGDHAIIGGGWHDDR